MTGAPIGHEQALARLMDDLSAGTLAHGLLFCGSQGIGKSLLAHHFATHLLTKHLNPHSHDYEAAQRRIEVGSHPDLLVLEPIFDEKKDALAREITVEQAREIGEFLSLTPGEAKWRVVVIDSVDALNVNAANAILKVLEEPPAQAVLLLISHVPGRLLPTIRSRCRTISLRPPEKDQFQNIIRNEEPSILASELDLLYALSYGSPGQAITLYRQGAIQMYQQILMIFLRLPNINPLEIHSFIEQFSGSEIHDKWRLFSQLTLLIINILSLVSLGSCYIPDNAEDEMQIRQISGIHTPARWAEKWQDASEQFSLAQALHLDYKQVALSFFHSLASAEPFQLGGLAA